MSDIQSSIGEDGGGEVRTPALEARDPFAAGMFPVCVASHDTGLRFLFDLSTLLLLLNCRPGDRVLDVGAGSGFSSEMLARLGYDVVAVDPDRVALGHNRRRPSHDSQRIDGTVRVVQGVGEQLPFADRSFDGIVGMNVVHHIPDLPMAIAEFARVIRPGCRAVFSEPGLEHLGEPETARAIREFGENDQAFDVLTFMAQARTRGFAHAMLSATVHPLLRLLPLEEVDLFGSGQHHRPPMTPAGVVEELHRRHSFSILIREGVRMNTSRYPSVLRCDLTVDPLAARAHAGDVLRTTARASNTGDTVWLATPSRFGGYVNAGCKLLAADGRLVTDRIGRVGLPHDVSPGQSVTVPLTIVLPEDLEPGAYRLQIDLVDEMVCWFSDASTAAPSSHAIEVA